MDVSKTDDGVIRPGDPGYEADVTWNLFLHKQRNGRYLIVMPDQCGVLDPVPTKESHPGDSGYLVRWPMNPNFTGEAGIAEMLRAHAVFADAVFVAADGQTY